MPAKPSVFISYRRKTSADLARYIHHRLQSLSYDTFLDVETINGGRFSTIIKKQIINRDVFVVILTPDSLESEWVIREIQTAFEYEKPIIPLMAQGCSFDKPLSDKITPTDELKQLIDKLSGYDAVRWDHDFAEAAFGYLLKSIDPNYQQAAEFKPKPPMSTEVKVAIIGGIFLVIGAAISILPNLLSRTDNPSPTQNVVIVSSPTNSPAPTNTLTPSETPLIPTSTLPATLESTATTDSAATVAAQQTTIAVMIGNTQTAQAATANALPTTVNTPSPTPVPPTATPTLVPPTASFTPVQQTIGYPCAGKIAGTRGALLNQVRVRPQKNAPFRPAVEQGIEVTILDKATEGGTIWYQIQYGDNKENAGWIPANYINGLTNCP